MSVIIRMKFRVLGFQSVPQPAIKSRRWRTTGTLIPRRRPTTGTLSNDGDFNTPSLAHDGVFNTPSLAKRLRRGSNSRRLVRRAARVPSRCAAASYARRGLAIYVSMNLRRHTHRGALPSGRDFRRDSGGTASDGRRVAPCHPLNPIHDEVHIVPRYNTDGVHYSRGPDRLG